MERTDREENVGDVANNEGAMCDKDLLVGYLYGELEPGDRRTFEAHLTSCEACRLEVRALQGTRARLGEWEAPSPDLDFQIVRGPRPVVGVKRVWQMPAWGLAAAAVLTLAAASAIANLDVRYDASGLTVRTGWSRSAPVTAAAVPAAPASSAGEAEGLRRELVALQTRLDRIESAARTPIAEGQVQAASLPTSTTTAPAAAAPPDLMRQVQRLVSDSETRQQRELALRVQQLWRDVSTARRADMDAVQRGLQEVQGLSDTTLVRQRELENQMFRAVAQRPRP